MLSGISDSFQGLVHVQVQVVEGGVETVRFGRCTASRVALAKVPTDVMQVLFENGGILTERSHLSLVGARP